MHVLQSVGKLSALICYFFSNRGRRLLPEWRSLGVPFRVLFHYLRGKIVKRAKVMHCVSLFET